MRSTSCTLLANECFIVTESNKVLKLKFQKLQPTVVKNVNAASIMDVLFQEAVIGGDDMRALQNINDDPQQQCGELMTLLHASEHPQAFIQLYLAIKCESHLQWLVERIDKFSDQSVIDLLQQLDISEPTGCVNMCLITHDHVVQRGIAARSVCLYV